jgi:hypothetical protein
VETEAGKGFVNQAQTGGIRIEKTSDDGVTEGLPPSAWRARISPANAFSKDFVTDEKARFTLMACASAIM